MSRVTYGDGGATTLGYALLGLLAHEDLSGYDLARRMKEWVGFFWSARHSQIYPELARLEDAGFVAHTPVPQRDRPDKKVFAVTEAGRGALRQWLTSPFAPTPHRDELVLRAYAVWLADPGRAAALFREEERHHAARLAEYRAILAHLEQTCGDDLRRPDVPFFGAYAALRRGIGYEREYGDWCGWLADTLDQAAADPDRLAAMPGTDTDPERRED